MSIKDKTKRILSESEESVKGISKGAIAMLLWLDTFIMIILLCITAISVIRLACSEVMTDHALELRDAALEERSQYKADYEFYKTMYDNVMRVQDAAE